ncbi:MFS transporter [Muricoccus radiodurans]|uniref:MFS transporter n=1 Tax=Muricoccus radiodurans TaxID=2231721 RepID=UPI003CEE8872
MRLPAAFVPLRHPVFRMLWVATLVSNIGGWVQSTAAGWVMTSLSPSPLMVSLVQVASLLPVFLLALPAGALADIVDRRRFLLGTQVWVCAVACLLCVLTSLGALGPWGLLALTFLIGVGAAANFPAWAATTPELVPRADLAQAIVLNGMAFNLARAVGPAFGGLLIGWVGAGAAFAFNALSFLVLIAAILAWKRAPRSDALPSEGLLDAMRAGLRYVAASPAMRGVIVRGVVAFFSASAVWGLLPLLVRQRLGLGPEAFGLLLGCMGIGAVSAGFALPGLRARVSPSAMVVWGSIACGASIILLGLSTHWLPAVLAMLAYGASWLAVASTLSAAAQMAARPWVRARAIGLFQVATFGGLAAGSATGGVLGSAYGIPVALTAFGIACAVLSVLVRHLPLEAPPAVPDSGTAARAEPMPAAASPDLLALFDESRDRVLESVRYEVPAADRAAFLSAMAEVRGVRLRAGALLWRLYEDVARPERYLEIWAVPSWTDHLREQGRLSEADHAALIRAAAFHRAEPGPQAERFLQVPLALA